jgi:carboxypeptidase family protein
MCDTPIRVSRLQSDEWRWRAVTWRTACQLGHAPRTQLIPLVHQLAIGFPRRARADRLAAVSILILFVLILCSTAACSTDRESTAQAKTAKSSAGVIALPSVPYKPVALSSVGAITGTIEIDGDAPADSIVTPPRDQEVCGTGYPDSSVVRHGNLLANAVVWLTDVKQGKELPVERRTEIINEECRLTPRVQAVVAGTTVNVRNEDRLAHTTRFLLGGAGGDTLARIPLTDDGQVVPNEHIAAKAGLIAVTCAQHAWTRGFIAVIESPYFAVTDQSGTFRLDSIPPGRYHLRVWHERGAPVEQDVDVTPEGTSKVAVKVKLR